MLLIKATPTCCTTILLLCLSLLARGATAILQTAQVDVQLSNGATYTLLASQASFGAYPKQGVDKNEAHGLTLAPTNNALLCQNVTEKDKNVDGTFVVVPRGECTFETKAMNAQRLGAVGVIVRGSLDSRYSVNKTTSETIYPTEFNDFDCAKGSASIPASAIAMLPDGKYDFQKDDPVLSGTSASNLCLANSADSLINCDSKACLLTGNKTESGDLQACCAWDLHIWLYNDPTFSADDVTIPAVYISLEQSERLVHDLETNQINVTVSARIRSSYNMSAMLIWALGVFVAAIAAYASASDIRSMTRALTRRLESSRLTDSGSVDESLVDGGVLQDGESVSLTNAPPSPRAYTQQAEETLELSAEHALGFIVMASSGLLILFFFKIYGIVKILYGFGCSRAVMQVIFLPLFEIIFRRGRITNKILCRTNIEDIGDITTIDLLAGICAYALGMTWLFVAFTVHHAETNTFFWVTQDIMGACMCIMFLSIIKLNSMRVASILLLVAFFYDIFFVFVTPLIFKGESVMIAVATSGGPPKADPMWCEKYPDASECQGGDPLPMLLTVPRLYDYQGGASLLGLGDIVLPGLLLSFAARLDAAKEFMGVVGGGNGTTRSNTCPPLLFCGFCNGGYFAPLVVAYAIGLFMANAAVYLMNMGQPALLYLVPMCLGSMMFMGTRRNELAGLWEGPKIIKTVDAMIYGEYEQAETTLVEEDGLEAVPSTKDDEDE
mmetsp:Transcript_19545/g.32453  ORF Transcript_19545/g.32453 Transcript_19545/m.32453 type:complete len:725 (+) Transcript_19545:325-2499(+)